MNRGLALAIGFLVGLLIGVIGGFEQAQRLIWGSMVIPWGVVLMLIALMVLVRGGAWLAMSRWGGWALFIGWLVATMVMSAELPDGSVALSGGGRQLFYLIGGVILGAATASLPVPLRPVAPRERAGVVGD